MKKNRNYLDLKGTAPPLVAIIEKDVDQNSIADRNRGGKNWKNWEFFFG